ncbi:hypothetical protein HPB52_012474 [Rhipicephalus sanguineus]|uniref:Sulfotransferase domain-containing protein n=1 Tax=Rhipicephalus sanguineus TaxID=34632 RepID=A0A9D4T5R4_RHISA|nr:hypothetical protein HPB52_012474 [Rhipicephalus sanguineus]
MGSPIGESIASGDERRRPERELLRSTMGNVDGLWIHESAHEDLIRSALTYKPRQDDIFLVTYPKCGTTWTPHLILSILTDGHPPKTVTDFMLASPFMELMGAETAEKMVRPVVLKTHFPFTKLPYSTQAKYIYVTRNPYDFCVSYYYHMKSRTPKEIDASFERFCKVFMAGKVSYGDYFDHLLSWYEHRNDPNLLFFTYEQIKEDTDFWTLQTADFMGEQYGKKLRVLLSKLVDACTLKNMQSVFNEQMRTLVKDMFNLGPDRAIKSMEAHRGKSTDEEPLHSDDGFVRKGIVGDWKAHFTNDQIEHMKAWIAKKTSGSDVELWKKCDLPR